MNERLMSPIRCTLALLSQLFKGLKQQGFELAKKGVQGAAKEAQKLATKTAKFVAKPVVHAAKTTAKVAKAATQKVADQVHKAENGINDWKRYGIYCYPHMYYLYYLS
jgi:dsDNA-specific endonuclease/ATPase MutS2